MEQEFRFSVTIYPDSDEWWEELDKMSPSDRIEALRFCIKEALESNISYQCEVNNKNYFQAVFPDF